MTLHIEQEIQSQPEVIANLISAQAETVQQIAKAIQEFDPAFVCIAARGTSDNAGRYAQYLLGIRARLSVALATPSVHTLYASPPNLSRALVIGISQSGQSEDITKVVKDAEQQNALTLAITNDPASPMAQAAQFHINLNAGQEISVAATKTYTAQLTAIALLATALTQDAEMADQLRRLPDDVRKTIQFADTVQQWVERYRYMDHFACVGRGYNYCTAFEISLKIKELCYITGEEYSEADFRHGPIAVIQPGFPTLVVAPNGRTLLGLIDLLEKLSERQAECLVISNHDVALSHATKHMLLPHDQPEWLTPITAVIPGQIFAMNLALVKGHSVDTPEGLTKVTNTI